MMKIRTVQRLTLRELLDAYNIQYSQALKLSGVHRTTFERWLKGETTPPPAIMDYLRLHADGQIIDPAFDGFQFVRGRLYDDNGQGYEKGDIRSLAYFKRYAHAYFAQHSQPPSDAS